MKKDKNVTTGANTKRFGSIVIILIFYSIALPFIMELVYSGINGNPLNVAFHGIYKYFVLSGIIFAMLYTIESYIYYRRKDLIQDYKQLCIILFNILLTYIFAIIFASFISPFCMPLILSGLIMAILIDKRLSLFANILIDIIFFLCYITISPDALSLAIISSIITQAISGSLMVILMKKHYTRISFLAVGIAVGLGIALPMSFLCSLLSTPIVWSDVLLSGVWSFIAIVLGLALFMIILPVFETILGVSSNFRLEEICSPETSLMKELAERAPGTYNHSLAVANLAQACAMRIGENPTLARAAACYHDVGKIKEPLCFSENQTDYNPHDDFIPEVSVFKITEHTSYGAKLIKKNSLPNILADIAKQHHGTTSVQYFLNKAKAITDEQLDKEQFSYPGPKPETKMAAIIMICDTVEAATRAQGVDKDEKDLRKFIHGLIAGKAQQDQFINCPITYRDLHDIEDCLVETVPSLYHQRIKYTENKA